MAYECKWGDKSVKIPLSFLMNYPESEFKTINRENDLEFIL